LVRVILLAGLPGVGKSTLARRIAAVVNGKVLDIDKIKKELVDPSLVASTIDPPEVRWKCYERAFEEIFVILGNGTSTVVVDEVFHLHSLREKLEALCVGEGSEVMWIEVVCSRTLVEERLRAKLREGHILSTDEALKMNALFAEIFEKFPPHKINVKTFVNEGPGDVESLVL